MKNLKKQGYIAFLWDFGGKIATQGAGLIITIFLARLLTPTDFGMIAMIMVIVGMASIFTDVGLASALIQKRRALQAHYSSVFFFNLALGVIFSIIIFFCAPYIASFYEAPTLEPLTKAIAFLFVIDALGTVQGARLRKSLKYSLLTKASFTASLLGGITGVALAYFGAGVWSLVIQMLLSSSIRVSILWIASGWRPSLIFSFKALRYLWKFGFRMFLSGLLNAVADRISYVFIGKLFPAAILGYFQRAKSLNMLIISYSSGSLMSVMFPVLSKVQHDLPRFKRIIIKGMHLISFVVFMLLGGMYVTSAELIQLLFGPQWLPSIEMFRILALSGFGYPISALLVNVLSSRGNSKDFLKLEIYKKMLIPFNILTLYFFGLYSFMYFLVFTTILAVLMNIYFVEKEISIGISTILKPILTQMALASISAFTVIFLIGDHSSMLFFYICLKGVVFLGLYFAINKIVKSKSLTYFIEESRPLYNKLVQKVKNGRSH